MMDDEQQPKSDKVLGFGLLIMNLVATCILIGAVILLGISSFSMVFSLLGQFSWQSFRIGFYTLGAGIAVYSIGRAMCYFANLIKEANQQNFKENLLKIYGLSLASEVCTIVLAVAGYCILLMTIGALLKWDQNFLYALLIWASIFVLSLRLRIFLHRYMDRFKIELENASESN